VGDRHAAKPSPSARSGSAGSTRPKLRCGGSYRSRARSAIGSHRSSAWPTSRGSRRCAATRSGRGCVGSGRGRRGAGSGRPVGDRARRLSRAGRWGDDFERGRLKGRTLSLAAAIEETLATSPAGAVET
jgi:hypothetical protein